MLKDPHAHRRAFPQSLAPHAHVYGRVGRVSKKWKGGECHTRGLAFGGAGPWGFYVFVWHSIHFLERKGNAHYLGSLLIYIYI